MELRQLRYFQAVAETGTFTAAAERSRVAQPALWKQVRDLERELGVGLFEKAGRRVRLTSSGALLLERVAHALESADRVKSLAADLRLGRTGQVVISCSPPHINRILALAVREFNRENPSVHVELREYPGESGPRRFYENPFLAELRSGVADLAIAEGPVNEFEALHLYDVHAVVLVPDDHPWRRRRFVMVDRLRGVPLTVTPEGFASRRLLDKACRSAGFEPTIERISGSPISIVAMGVQGAGIAVVADDVPPSDARPWPRIQAGSAPVRESVHLHWRRTQQPAAVHAFISTVRSLVGKGPPISPHV